VGAAGDVQLDGPVGGLVTLDGLPEGDPESLGGVEIDDETLRNLDLLATAHEGVGVQGEVDDDFFRRRGHAREVGVGSVRLLIVEDDLGALLLLLLLGGGLGGFTDSRVVRF